MYNLSEQPQQQRSTSINSGTLAQNIKTGNAISLEEYEALPHQNQQNYRILRYLDATDDEGTILCRVIEDHNHYIANLTISDIDIQPFHPDQGEHILAPKQPPVLEKWRKIFEDMWKPPVDKRYR